MTPYVIVENTGTIHRISPYSTSMTNEEAQEEEREVLASIYESDDCFKQISPTTISYRVGEQGHPQSFIIEVKWGEEYPDEIPTISLDSFYNKHLSQECKKAIIEVLEKEAAELLGSPMTYSLIEHVQDHAAELVTLRDPVADGVKAETCEEEEEETVVESRRKEKKEVLSKRAKRKLAERTNAQGERPRGWDWVDVVKLSKTGSQPS